MAHTCRSLLVSGFVAVALAPSLGAQAALVADLGSAIAYTRQEHYGGLALSATRDGIGYFLYDDGVHGRELWRSDGSLVGTYQVVDACPGECGAAWSFAWDALVATSEAVYFAASDGVHGEEIWRSDGTAAGTRMVRDVAAGLRSSAPNTLRRVGERVFFTAESAGSGRELWVSDGTESGTQQVAELGPGAEGIYLSSATELGGNLLFGLVWSGPGALWRSDGTPAGTYLLANVAPWQQNWSANAPFDVVNGRLVFWGDDWDSNYDPVLWVSDGTPGGTEELSVVADPSLFVRLADELYFASPGPGGGLYRTDGTPSGTSQVDLPKGTRVTTAGGYAGAARSTVFFAADDGDVGRELWATDGDATWLVADIRPGPDSGLAPLLGPFFSLHAPGITGFGDRVVFYADDGSHGRELWVSDGTPRGTRLLVDFTPGPAPTLSDGVTSYAVPAALDSGVLLRPLSGEEDRTLWRSDGTPAGTALVSTIRSQTSGFLPFAPGTIVYANPHPRRCFVPLGEGVLFSIRGAGDRWELWFASGAPPAAQPVETLASDPTFEQAPFCRPFGGVTVLEADVPAQGEDGLFTTTGEFGSLTPIVLGSRPGASLNADAVTDPALFLGGPGSVWQTDGTAPNTFVYETPGDTGSPELEALGGRILVASTQLFVTSKDGSALESIVINGENFSWPLKLAAAGERAYLLATTGAEGTELWSTDGTQEGTSLVRDIRPGIESAFHEEAPGEGRSTVSSIVPLGTLAVFAADDGVHGEELWISDGTLDGTVLLADLAPGSYPSSPRELTRVGGRVYFVAESPGTGRELWRTDGTSVGTELVADLVAGAGSSIPQELTAAGSELYFSAWTPGAGREPWRLRENGAPAPLLAPLADVAPGPLSSSPLAFLEVGGRVFFPANDNALGFELWSVQEPDAIFSDGFESSGTAVWSAVFAD